MKVGGFYEHQLPRPWTRDSEHRLFKDALDQVELADRLGFAARGEGARCEATKEKAALKQRIIEKAMARKRDPEVPNWGPTVIKAAGHH
jgi:hypothetical protein